MKINGSQRHGITKSVWSYFNSVDSKFNETFSEEIWFAWN